MAADGPTASPPQLFLQPGQVAAFGVPAVITTILGSCVAVCLWEAGSCFGGMNHFVLPDWSGRVAETPRYADKATEELLRQMDALGARRSRMQAKLFGGSCVLRTAQPLERHLGIQNADAARRLLAAAGVPIVAEDLGGPNGRKVVFHTHDGVALVKRL